MRVCISFENINIFFFSWICYWKETSVSKSIFRDIYVCLLRHYRYIYVHLLGHCTDICVCLLSFKKRNGLIEQMSWNLSDVSGRHFIFILICVIQEWCAKSDRFNVKLVWVSHYRRWLIFVFCKYSFWLLLILKKTLIAFFLTLFYIFLMVLHTEKLWGISFGVEKIGTISKGDRS